MLNMIFTEQIVLEVLYYIFVIIIIFYIYILAGRCCDEGKSFLEEYPDTPTANCYQQVIKGEPIMTLFTLPNYLPSIV